MRKFITPSKDATIYQAYPTNNSGLDEILEIGKVVDVSLVEPSYATASARSILYFDLPTSTTIPNSANYFLNLKIANASNIQRNQKLLVYKVSKSWDEGSGFFYQDVKNVNDGATWRQSALNTSWSYYGGDILTGSTSASATLSTYPLEDIRIDVTNILQPIVSQSLQNTFYGLIVKFPDSEESNIDNEGNLKVFSAQTHTIHQPTLEIAWDNQVFSTGSISSGAPTIIPSVNVKVIAGNLKEVYSKGDTVRLNLTVRDEFPPKTFDSILRYRSKYYLPTSSYYSVVDTQANVTVVPFDDYSKINTDINGSYIILDTSPLYKGRFYTLKIKIETGSYSRTVSTDTIFKII